MKLSLTMIFLQNICLKTEGFHFLKRMLFCCFNHMEGILHTCSHDSFQTNPLLLHIVSYYCIILQSIDSQPSRGRQEALHIQAPTHFFRKTIFIQNRFLKGFHSDILLSFFRYFFGGALHSCLFENDVAFMSNKCSTLLCKGIAQNGVTSWKELALCQECYIIEKKYYCIRHILEGLKRNARGHAEFCLLIIYSSRACVVFFPMVFSNFLGGCPNHEKIDKTCTVG